MGLLETPDSSPAEMPRSNTWFDDVPMKHLLRLRLYIFIPVLMLICILLGCRSKKGPAEHIEATSNRVGLVMAGFANLDKGRLSRKDHWNTHQNSWRLQWVAWTPWPAGENTPPSEDVPWQSEAWHEWDNDTHTLFCLQECTNSPRNVRYTGVMTILGEGSAFEFLQQEGYQELSSVAPNAILLVEVVNSSVPWMQAGDLELDKLPRSINHPGQLGIGSVHGYDKFVVSFADGSIWAVDSSIPFSVLEKFLTVEGAKQEDRALTLGPYSQELEPFPD